MIFKFFMQTASRSWSSVNLFHLSKHQCPSVFGKAAATTKYGSRMQLQPPRARQKHVNNGNKFRGPCVILVKNVITPPPPPLLTIREHVQRVNYVTHLAGTLRHPTPEFNFWTLIFANFIFQMCNPSKGSWMAHLKIRNPSKGGVSAACLKTI